MDNRASSLFALVRGCKDSSGLHEFAFGHRISLLFVALALMFLIPHSASAQATATLNGVVRDSSSAVIPQATVAPKILTPARRERVSPTIPGCMCS